MNETKAARSPGRVNLVPDHMTKQSYAVVIVCFLCWMFSTIGNGVYSVASPMLDVYKRQALEPVPAHGRVLLLHLRMKGIRILHFC